MDDLFNNDALPVHVGIIMDGNGRWAKKRNLLRTNGHTEGLKRAKEIPKKSYIVGGHFSEWCRDKRVFKDIKFIEYANLCKKNRRVYPMIDEDLLTIDPKIENLLNYVIIFIYAPELLEYDFLSGNMYYNYNKQQIIKKILENKFKNFS